MKNLFFSLITLVFLVSCNENDPLTSAEQDIKTFSQQLAGAWVLESTTIVPVAKSSAESIAIGNAYACTKLASNFEQKDVVNEFEISFENNVLRVFKTYTCSLPPEELSWVLDPDPVVDEQRNWMTGKVFTIREVNEAAIQAEYSVLFFNLDHGSPAGQPATAETTNKLILDVEFDIKESSDCFRLNLTKVR